MLLLAVFAPSGMAGADEGLWSVGARNQGFWDFEPGNDYFQGPEIGYSNLYLASHRLQIKAAYLTNRPEQAFRANILRQDYFLFSPVWHFRRSRFLDPTVQLDLGYLRYDTEFPAFEDLENGGWLAAFQVGLNLNLAQAQWGLYYHFGYTFILPESSPAIPGVFGVGLWIML